jgi:hypothetical protein
MRIKLLFFLIASSIISCGSSIESADESEVETVPVQIPKAGAKVVFVFMPGGGAFAASAAVLAQLEDDLKLSAIGEITDLAVGASSGALLAATLSIKKDNGKFASAQEIERRAPSLVKNVFGDFHQLKNLVDEQVRAQSGKALDDAELNPLIEALVRGKTKAGGENILISAANLLKKVGAKISQEFVKSVLKLMSKAKENSENLAQEIFENMPIDANTRFSNPKLKKFIALASQGNDRSKKRPLLFCEEAMGKLTGLPVSASNTPVITGLLASTSIPKLFLPQSARFVNATQNLGIINDIRDVVFAWMNLIQALWFTALLPKSFPKMIC